MIDSLTPPRRPRFYSPSGLALGWAVIGAALWLAAFALNAMRNHDGGQRRLLWQVIVAMVAIAWLVGGTAFYLTGRSSRWGDRAFASAMVLQGVFLILAQLAS